MRLTKKTILKDQAQALAAGLRRIDLDLIEVVCDVGGLNLKVADQLVAMQRRIRCLRYEIEAECGVDAVRRMPGGGPRLSASGGDRRGEDGV